MPKETTTPGGELTLRISLDELRSPEGRARVAGHLCATLQAVAGEGCVTICPRAGDRAARATLRALDRAARQAAELAETIDEAERFCERATRPALMAEALR